MLLQHDIDVVLTRATNFNELLHIDDETIKKEGLLKLIAKGGHAKFIKFKGTKDFSTAMTEWV